MDVSRNGRRITRALIRANLAVRYPKLAARRKAKAQLPAVDRTAIALGRNEHGAPILLGERARLEHAHVIGTTGGGKTNFLEHCIRQDIVDGRAAIFIDPHGNHPDSPYRSLLGWLTESKLAEDRVVHLIDANDPDHTVGFNPLARPDPETDLSVIAGTTLEAFERVWGDEDTHAKPTIRRILTATFAALAERGLTLAEADLLFDPNDRHGIREHLVHVLDDRYASSILAELHKMGLDDRSKRDFRTEVVGPINRIAEFVRSPAIRNILGQTEKTIDLRKALDEGHIILINLSGGQRVYEADAELLGRLLTRFVFFHAKRRQHPERPCFFYLDECQRYLSGDVEAVLAEVRKFGVGVVLAHQWLAQLGAPDDALREAALNATNFKAVFRVKSPKEAEELASAVVPLNLETPVSVLEKPTVVGNRRALFRSRGTATHEAYSMARAESLSLGETDSLSEGESSSISESETTSAGASAVASQSLSSMQGVSSGRSSGQVMAPDTGPFMTPELFSESAGAASGRHSASGASSGTASITSSVRSSGHVSGRSSSSARTHASSWSRSKATIEGEMRGLSISEGVTEGLEPIHEVLPSAVHGKENVLYLAAQMLRSLKTGQAFINFLDAGGMQAALLRVPRIQSPRLSEEAFTQGRGQILQASPSAIGSEEAARALHEREQRLIAEAQAGRKETESKEPASFRVPTPRKRKGNPNV